ncbi:MAG: serine kinase [Deltaproteobacteria bacterium]|jgi:hypothetical protein|nr:serine kinase [Deltaproteobacteria bacterium]
MTLKEIVEGLGLRALTTHECEDRQVTGGYTSDLLSDVMANARPGNLWITLQIHQNIVAVARLKDLAGIVVVNGRRPDDETLRRADAERVAVLGTEDSAFRVSGRLHRLLGDS